MGIIEEKNVRNGDGICPWSTREYVQFPADCLIDGKAEKSYLPHQIVLVRVEYRSTRGFICIILLSKR